MGWNLSEAAIITDSCTSLLEPHINKLNIHIIYYYIHLGKEDWRDLVSIQPSEFFVCPPTVQDLPTTACPGPENYVQMYTQALEIE